MRIIPLGGGLQLNSKRLLYYFLNVLCRVQLPVSQCFPILVLKETILFAQDSWPRLRLLSKQSCLQQSEANKTEWTGKLAGGFWDAIKARCYVGGNRDAAHCPFQSTRTDAGTRSRTHAGANKSILFLSVPHQAGFYLERPFRRSHSLYKGKGNLL